MDDKHEGKARLVRGAYEMLQVHRGPAGWVDQFCPYQQRDRNCATWCPMLQRDTLDDRQVVTLHCGSWGVTYELVAS